MQKIITQLSSSAKFKPLGSRILCLINSTSLLTILTCLLISNLKNYDHTGHSLITMQKCGENLILLNDLQRHNLKYKSKMTEAFSSFLEGGHFILGAGVTKFETSFAKLLDMHFCATVGNGTDAIALALSAVGIRESSEVILAANAGMYACHGVLACDANPIFCDIDPSSYGLNLDEAITLISPKTKAIIYTHLYGFCRDLTVFANELKNRNIFLIEDCAQATGARAGGKYAGTFGDISTFSFYPTKNLGALGDGGAVISNSSALIENIKMLRQYGWDQKYSVLLENGRNSRLDEIQALLLEIKLPDLCAFNMSRRDIARQYKSKIKNPEVRITELVNSDSYIGHLFVIECKDKEKREQLRVYLKQLGVASDVHYPIPDYRQKVFKDKYDSLRLVVTERLSEQILTLPCFPEMAQNEIDLVIDSVNSWVA